MATPTVIQEIITQMGGMGLRGAPVYCGTRQVSYQCKNGRGNSKVLDCGLVEYDTGVSLKVNGKRGKQWTIIVSLECSDTYTIYLLQLASPKKRGKGIIGEILDTREDIYCDQLQEVVERVYDEAIKKHNGGFINI
jgi:hypothetical protein